MKNITDKLRQYDLPLIVTTLTIVFWGVLNIYSASFHEYGYLHIKQAVYAFIGIITMFILANIDYRKITNISFLFYLIGVLALISVYFIGTQIYGATRWISLGPVTVQPSEFMKLVVILVTAKILGEIHEGLKIQDILKVLILTLIPVLLTVKQPDLGTGIMILLPALIGLFVAGIKKRYIISSLLVILISAPFIWEHLKPYQKNRILAFIMPEKDPFGVSYNIIQSEIAIGSGKIFGKGYLHGTQSKLYFLPEQHTDFIFSTIGEEWGFLVSATLVFLYLFLGLRILHIGNKSEDLVGKYICYMAGSLITIQAFINIAMTMGLAPAVGIPLPMISYGGSSLIMFLSLIGIVLNVSKKNREKQSKLRF